MLARLHYDSRSSNLKLFLVLIPEKEQDHHNEVTIHSPNGIIHNVLIIIIVMKYTITNIQSS